MDAQMIRRVLYDFFKFNPKHFYVQGSGTGYMISAAPQRQAPAPEKITWAFQGYKSVFTGEGDPPPDQPFRFKARVGTINNRPPSNINQEFIAPSEAETFVWIEATLDSFGSVTDSIVAMGEEIPVDPAPEDGPPPVSYRGIFRVDTDDVGLVGFSPLRKGSMDVHPVVTRVECESNTIQIQWTGDLSDEF